MRGVGDGDGSKKKGKPRLTLSTFLQGSVALTDIIDTSFSGVFFFLRRFLESDQALSPSRHDLQSSRRSACLGGVGSWSGRAARYGGSDALLSERQAS